MTAPPGSRQAHREATERDKRARRWLLRMSLINWGIAAAAWSISAYLGVTSPARIIIYSVLFVIGLIAAILAILTYLLEKFAHRPPPPEDADHEDADHEGGEPEADTLAAEKPQPDKPKADEPAAEAPQTDKPKAETTAAEKPEAETTAAEKPPAVKTSADQSPAVKTSADQSPAEKTPADKSPTDKTKAGGDSVGSPPVTG